LLTLLWDIAKVAVAREADKFGVWSGVCKWLGRIDGDAGKWSSATEALKLRVASLEKGSSIPVAVRYAGGTPWHLQFTDLSPGLWTCGPTPQPCKTPSALPLTSGPVAAAPAAPRGTPGWKIYKPAVDFDKAAVMVLVSGAFGPKLSAEGVFKASGLVNKFRKLASLVADLEELKKHAQHIVGGGVGSDLLLGVSLPPLPFSPWRATRGGLLPRRREVGVSHPTPCEAPDPVTRVCFAGAHE
jgi:hypothetical protein